MPSEPISALFTTAKLIEFAVGAAVGNVTTNLSKRIFKVLFIRRRKKIYGN